jgi:RNA polymerase sigma-70 factor (ECF subfamily)
VTGKVSDAVRLDSLEDSGISPCMATEVAAPLTMTDREQAGISPAASPAASIARIYAQYQAQVGRWALQLLGRTEHMEDIVQEVFLIVLREQTTVASLQQLDGGGDPLERWLYRTTANAVRSLRWRERWRRFWISSEESSRAVAQLPSDAPDALELLEQERVRGEVYAILDRLSERQRRVLTLFELEGLSGEQIAALTGTKLATVWVTLHRARAAFLKQVGRLEPSHIESMRRRDP